MAVLKYSLFLFLCICLVSCSKTKFSVEYRGLPVDTLKGNSFTVVFTSGFSSDRVMISYKGNVLVDSVATTEPSTAMATDFITIPELPLTDSLLLKVKGESFYIKRTKGYTAALIEKKDNQVRVIYTNGTLKFD